EIVVSDFDDEEVKIVNPSFTVDKVCQSPNDYVLVGSDANFVVTVVNDGDVTLDFTSSELGSFTLDPKEKKEEVVKVKTSEADCDGGVENTVSVTGKYVGGKDDCLQWEATVKSSPVAVCKVACPEFEIEKNCLGDVDFDTDPNAYFEIIIRNLGNVPLDFAVTDSNAVFDPPVVFPITIQDGGEKTLTAKIAVLECGEPIVNNVEVIGWYVSEKVWFDIQTDTAECPCEEQGDEGCTPGFWKNSYGCWCGTYKEKDMDQVGEVFEIPKGLDELENDTLLEALKYGGGRGEIGAARNLLRHGVAALLNACSDPVEFKYSEQEVIDKVDIALASLDRRTINDAKDDLAKENERGCPISSDNANEPCTRHDDFDD
ncbi:MAG: hypothetical protein ACYTFX_09515, partial [Planctomycetota bacterium]